MKENVSGSNMVAPMLFPYAPEQYWSDIRQIIRDEIRAADNERSGRIQKTELEFKPLYKISEVCSLFQVSKPTIYDWIRRGKLTRHRIGSRVYFLWKDIQQLISPSGI